MIQRVQTVWLFLAAVAGFSATQFPMYKGVSAVDVKYFSAPQDYLLFAITSLAALLGFVAIFLFKNRKSQMNWTLMGMLVSLASIACIVWRLGAFKEENPALTFSFYWGALMPIVMFVFFILAAINIGKDDKLIKSLDRLR